MKQKSGYFTLSDGLVFFVSVTAILLAFFLFDRVGYANLLASLLGVASLLLCAKGHPIGQLLMILFSLFYGAVSYSFAYYGEMITYLGMTAPMALLSFVSWIKHPHRNRHSEVAVRTLKSGDVALCIPLTIAVTVSFYFILKAVGTANLLPSTLSVATSFVAVYFTFLRSPYFALAYAMNDLVLIVLWGLAVRESTQYLSVFVCFFVFFFNDLYGFISWCRMAKRQKDGNNRAHRQSHFI